MKQSLITLLFILAGCNLLIGQATNDKIPKKVRSSIPELTIWLTKGCETETEKADRIYSWITSTIKYDVKYLEKNDCGRFEGPEKVLKSKKTTCMGYVYLMGAMLDELNIEWELISGYTGVSRPYYVAKYLVDDHAWIAVKLGGDWHMADPTWDAGYIGALPKKDRRPSLERQQKKIDKIVSKNERLLAEGKEAEQVPLLDTAKDNVAYSGRIGFVQTGTREWFLVPADSFLTRHLPANPLWQLRVPNLSLPVFSQGPDSVRNFFAANPDQGYVPDLVDVFQRQPVLDKVLINGIMGNRFNSINTRTTAVHYHRFLEILNIPEVKKHFKGLPESYNKALTQKMIQVSDSTILLTKTAQAFEKNRHKEVTAVCAKGFKNANAANKKFQAATDKVKKWNAKVIANIDKSDLKLKADFDRVKTADETRSKPVTTLNLDAIANVNDQVKQLSDSIDKMESRWQKAIADSFLIRIINETAYSSYLLEQRKEILQQKSLHMYQYVELIDSYLLQTVGKLDTLYNDSLAIEIYPAAINKIALQLSKNFRMIDLGLEEAVKKGNIKDPAPYRSYYQDLADYYTGVAKKNIPAALRHNEFIKAVVEDFDKNWDKLSTANEEQVKLAEDKNDHILEEEEHTHSREEDLLKTISAESARWKAKLKEKL